MNLFDFINENTGFANGDIFKDRNDVKKYFTIDSMKLMFGKDHGLTQDELDEMAKVVISNRWHMKGNSKVFSVRIDRNDSEEEIDKKISELQEKARRFTT